MLNEEQITPALEPTTELRAEPTTELRAEPTSELRAEPTSELRAEPTSELRAQPTTELRAQPNIELSKEPKTTIVSNEKKPPSDLCRKLNALALIVGHDVLLVGAISYFSQGIDWLWKNFNILEAGLIGFQLVIIAWLMLPSTSWRIRPVALYLSIGTIYVGILFVVMYVFAYPLIHPMQFQWHSR